MSKLDGRDILITGASQGLGREMALRFAREGARALSLVARHAGKLNAVRDEVLKIAPKVDIVTIEADVSKSRDIERIVATTLAQFKGALDVMVNNASTIGPSPMPYLLDYPVEDPSEWANPADVTDVFVFLASNESKNVTGKRFQAQEDWKAQINHEAHEVQKR